ncbi:hypothetical protein ACSV5G_10780 [Agrobacterium cavarae]|uniref:hypothetical protein n=1 Tax=Agrobacterium cavarae TaxID=2528239 RepID=UPI003FD563CC
MVQKFRIIMPLIACILASACSAFSTESAIVGRWQSPTWTFSREPVYAEFETDGTLTFLTPMGQHTGKWKIMDNGDLKVTYHSGSSKICKASVSGSTLTITPSSCMLWNDLGSSVALEKQ